MTGCCRHSPEWHANDGCRFPGCPCKRYGNSPEFKPPKGHEISRCSECKRRPDKYGANHAESCRRRGEGPDLREDKKA